MKNANEFISHLRSRFLDAINNLMMQLDNPNLGEDFETKEKLIEMIKEEAEYLKKKRDGIMSDIEKFLSGKNW